MLFCMRTFRALPMAAGLALALGLGGCETTSDPAASAMASDPAAASMALATPEPIVPAPVTTPTVQEPGSVKYFPSDEPLRLGLEHFNRGNYGLAEHYFRDAVERSPRDATAWVGLAASYDRLARFDLADRAYRFAIKLAGETTQILNNQGYSYMLRGNYAKARQKLMKANAREPNNPLIVNNLQLLDSSRKYANRSGD
jgi:Flp pilus assembly protein TadD